MAIDWDKAPDGATHCWMEARFSSWRKVVDGEGVFQWNGFRWIKLPGTAELWEATHGKDPRLIKRPEEDPFWKDAPEGTTHYVEYKRNPALAWWVKDVGDDRYVLQLFGRDLGWSNIKGHLPSLLDNLDYDIKIRNDKGKVVEKEQPKPVQKVGWW